MLKLLWSRVSTICLVLAISTTNGLNRNPANPGSGMNFYKELPDATISRRPEILIFEHSDCSKNEKDRDSFFNDPDFCCDSAESIECDYSCPYRKYNGSCNNQRLPSLGMSGICYLRLTPASYEGKGGLRKSVTGDPLPLPREISLEILKDVDKPTTQTTYLFTGHGQIIAHDLSLAEHSSRKDCCSPGHEEKEECISIVVSPDDPYFSQINTTCLHVKRSFECTLCNTVHRAQRNTATATLDVHITYGVTEEKAKDLRKNDGTGQFKATDPEDGYLLTDLTDEEKKGDLFCPKDVKCFKSADPRVNMHATLTSFQTIYMREHNGLARKLKKINPHWGEEKLFQEARKILIAKHQCITYKEYLPVLLGQQLVESFGLAVKQGEEGEAYHPYFVLAVFQEFGHAAFRLHSMVPSDIGVSDLRFKDTYSNSSLIRKGFIASMTAGSYRVTSQKNDPYVIDDLSLYLAQPLFGKLFGTDLSAIDIKRGRDHGLAPYVEVVKFCSGGTIEISSFKDLDLTMPPENIELLQRMYKDVRDVDMWVGMLMETPYQGSLLGPSATCVNIIQFYSAKKGDRLFFDLKGPKAPFTPDQRNALKQCSLARILCDNTKITHITKNPYILPSDENPDVPCEEIPEIDLTPWKDPDSETDIPSSCSL